VCCTSVLSQFLLLGFSAHFSPECLAALRIGCGQKHPPTSCYPPSTFPPGTSINPYPKNFLGLDLLGYPSMFFSFFLLFKPPEISKCEKKIFSLILAWVLSTCLLFSPQGLFSFSTTCFVFGSRFPCGEMWRRYCLFQTSRASWSDYRDPFTFVVFPLERF